MTSDNMTTIPPSPNRAMESDFSTRIVFVNRFYSPDMSATSQILSDVAEALAKRGHVVSVFTSRISYSGQQSYSKRENINGVEVHRVWSSRFGRHSTLGRSVDYLTFYLSIVTTLIFKPSRGDIVVAKTDPPMLSIPLGSVAKIKRAKLVNWLQDIFPEVAIGLGMGSSGGFLIRAMKRLRNRSLRRARMNVAIGERMAEFLDHLNVAAEQICVIENFADDVAITRSESHSVQLREEWGINHNDFVVGYSGNLGRAHDLDTILDTAERLKEEPQVKFLFVGGGYQHSRLTAEAERRELRNIVLKPYQPRSRLNESLALPNLHWASLAIELEGFMVPSKVYGIAAAGRPLLMVGDINGEVGRTLNKFKFGLCLKPGQITIAEKFIREAKEDQAFTTSMGRAARDYIEQHACRENVIAKWLELMRELSQSGT